MCVGEKELFEQIKMGSKKSKAILLQQNLHYVKEVVYCSFSNSPFDVDDLMQEGCIGLMNAIEHYDLNRNVRFSSYAVECIKNSIRNFIAKNKKHMDYDCCDIYGNYSEWIEQIPDQEDLLEKIEQQVMVQYILNILCSFPEKNQLMLRMSMGFNPERRVYTGEEIGKIFGCTRKNVSKTNKETIEHIKMILETQNISMQIRHQKVKK